ncbi:MAG: hypothetical protein ACTS22_01650 [Phycisphaerales bacterium]
MCASLALRPRWVEFDEEAGRGFAGGFGRCVVACGSDERGQGAGAGLRGDGALAGGCKTLDRGEV